MVRRAAPHPSDGAGVGAVPIRVELEVARRREHACAVREDHIVRGREGSAPLELLDVREVDRRVRGNRVDVLVADGQRDANAQHVLAEQGPRHLLVVADLEEPRSVAVAARLLVGVVVG